MNTIEIRRLTPADVAATRQLFGLMARVFDEDASPLGDAYLTRLLSSAGFWTVAAFIDGEVVGGLTAHTLPLTTSEASEIFIYDIAVRADRQRRGIGRALIDGLRDMAAAQDIDGMFVSADDEDAHALDFYRALGATGSPVTFFVFAGNDED